MINEDDKNNISDFSTKVVTEMITLIEGERLAYGPEYADSVSLTVLASYVCTLIYNTMRAADMPKELQTVENIGKRYAEMKLSIQNAVASGFQAATSSYSGLETEYYCQIKPVPSPINGLPC